MLNTKILRTFYYIADCNVAEFRARPKMLAGVDFPQTLLLIPKLPQRARVLSNLVFWYIIKKIKTFFSKNFQSNGKHPKAVFDGPHRYALFPRILFPFYPKFFLKFYSQLAQ